MKEKSNALQSMEMTRKYKVQCFLFSSSDTMIKNYKSKSSFSSLPFAVFIQCPQNSSIPVLSLPKHYTGNKTIGHI